jgi:hypothetical protein
MITILLWKWAEKSKNLLIRLIILGPFYIRMLYSSVEDLVKSFSGQKYFLSLFHALVIIVMFIVYSLSQLMNVCCLI